jgi:hypothetical protein
MSVILSVFYENITFYFKLLWLLVYIYNVLFQTSTELINSFLYLFILFGDGGTHWEKKTENCIIARSACCKISVIFRVIALLPNTQPFKNNFIPYQNINIMS